MNSILLFLLKKGAHKEPVTLSTRDIGESLAISQQSASRLLIELEKEGKIKREKNTIMLTEKGVDELHTLYSEMKHCFSGGKIRLYGKVINGLGEGKYYVSLEGFKKQFNEKLGFDPYLGTLNINLSKESVMLRHTLTKENSIIITGWKEKDRTFGAVFAYPCMIDSIKGAVIIPERTHHGPDVIELIAPVNIKKALKLKEGEEIAIEIL